MKKRITKKYIGQMLKDFDFEKEYARQSAERDTVLNDPANAEFFENCRERQLLAETLYNARIAAHLSQKEVAERMNVKQPYVAKLERGTGAIGWTAISRFAAACGKTATVTLS